MLAPHCINGAVPSEKSGQRLPPCYLHLIMSDLPVCSNREIDMAVD